MKLKFETMTRQELRAYILEHREDEEAFQVYLDKNYTSQECSNYVEFTGKKKT